MIGLVITLDIKDAPWPELAAAPAGVIERIARLPHGTTGGLSSVSVVVRLPDGSAVVGQSTVRLLGTAIDCFRTADEEAQATN